MSLCFLCLCSTKRSFVGGLNGGSNAICYGWVHLQMDQSCNEARIHQTKLEYVCMLGDTWTTVCDWSVKMWWCWRAFWLAVFLSFRLPNIGQNCYMISTLQSLLTLEDFMGDISRMENIWSSAPKAQMIKYSSHTHTHTHTHIPSCHPQVSPQPRGTKWNNRANSRNASFHLSHPLQEIDGDQGRSHLHKRSN